MLRAHAFDLRVSGAHCDERAAKDLQPDALFCGRPKAHRFVVWMGGDGVLVHVGWLETAISRARIEV